MKNDYMIISRRPLTKKEFNDFKNTDFKCLKWHSYKETIKE
ncbi:MAG: hypothetical protein ACI4VP_03330 [Clostridia bacterium]